MSNDTAAANRAFLERLYNAARQENWEEVLGMFAPDCVLYETEALPYGGTYHGLEEIGAVMAKLGVALNMRTLAVDYIVAENDHVVGCVRVQLNGGFGETRISEHWTIRDGKAVEARPFYWDPAAITAAAEAHVAS